MAEEKTFSVGVQTSSPKRISVTSNVSENPITASADTGLYYSQLAKNWAIGEGLIQNEDYSSKTWAGESKSSADLSKMYSEAASLDLNNLENKIIEYDEQLNTTITEGLDNINTSVTGGVETIETTKTEASEYVETTANESIAEVNQAKEQAIKDFNKASDKVNYLFVMPIGHIGFSPFPIDETKGLQRILNGQIIIQEQFTGFVKWLKDNIELYPQMACTEEQWQTTVTMSINGTCDKFVIDDEAGTIRLPKYPEYVNKEVDKTFGVTVTPKSQTATVTVTNKDKIGYLYIKGGTKWSGTHGVHSSAGNLYQLNENATNTASYYDPNGTLGVTFTPSVTSSTSSTSTEEKQKGYWFIQVATGAEETVDVTREIELNNPFFFGYYQYFEVAPNNISWLKSAGQWNSKAIYTDYYDWILTNANKGVANFKLSTDTYDDYSWVVNTADETFRLPIKTKNAPFTVSGAKTTLSMGAVSIKGNGKTLGLTDGTLTGGMTANNNYAAYGVFQKGAYNVNVGTAVTPGSTNDWTNTNKSIGVTTNASKSGLTGSVSGTATTTVTTADNTNVSLYFYVGETTQNANLVNVGRIEETVVNKINRTGDTMTGVLRLNVDKQYSDPVQLVCPEMDWSVAPSRNTNCGIHFYDKTGKLGPYFILVQNADSAENYFSIGYNGTNDPNFLGFNFPKASSKATTSSSASLFKPAVVTQNYVSGTSWYRVWSDGWIEQGGALHASLDTTSGVKTVNYLKSFSNGNYTLVVNVGINSSENMSYFRHPYAKTNTGFTYNKMNTGIGNWYVCGY